MDQTNQQKLSRFTKSQFLKKLTKLLLSISVFSLLFSTSNLLSFLQPWHFQLSTFPLRLVTHAVDKNCIFLLCNGILVFLAKNSGFIGTKTRSRRGTGNKDPAKETLYMMENKLLATDIDNGVFPNVACEDFALEEEGKTLNDKNNNHEDCVVKVEAEDVCFHAEECTRDDDDDVDIDEVEQDHSIHFSTLEAGNAVAISNSHGDEESDDCGGAREDETSEDYSYGNNAMTAEELDKKFDEFIRRMKEGIMMEAQQQQQQQQQQLLMV